MESGNVTWDVIDTGSTFNLAQCNKLFMPIDKTVVDTSKAPPELVTECGVPAMTYAYVMVYKQGQVRSEPAQELGRLLRHAEVSR